ncbi:FimB/Mfa2 family fimbrial subunit [uncultured Bacteroides sp.]|uniref:FimB/Mfa2 family fimbrial subunit n=1 Tax=uncultured Bacteroides sp. TaxID=162156 RepID=UPI0025E9E989|nr:FimB/Mfa2 family fimbrial subunit [uncultured Bacteroides sp.]
MENSIKHSLIATAALLLLAGCDVKDPIYNTPHPDKGAVTLTTDWSNIGEGLTVPTTYTVATGDYSATLSGTVNLLNHLFAPGEYSVFAYNTAEHITVSGSTATVATASGNVDGVGPFVHNAPGWLFTSVTDAVIDVDKDHAVTAAMQQQVRQLTLIIEPTGETTDRITGIEGYLTGAAASLDFANGTHSAPTNVALTFSKITSGTDAGKWSATIKLLGIAGTKQQLFATIVFTDNNPTPVKLDSDLTTVLATFNADKRSPFSLGGSVVETPTGAEFTATIIDWEPGNGPNGENGSAGMETNK